MSFRILAALLCMTATTASAQQWPDPETFPPLSSVTRPSVDPAVADLGRMLFFDPRLSGDSSTSCSECHNPEFGWTDGSDLGRGYPGTKHWRNSQSVVNAALLETGYHWDASVPSLLQQVAGAMGTGIVHNIDPMLAEERLRQIPEYRKRFQEIWGEDPTKETLAAAIAAYEGTLISDDSPFDRYLAGDRSAMSAAALRGFMVFAGKGNCTACHSGALLTDGDFHNISVPKNPEFADDPLRQVSYRFLMRQSGLDSAIYNNLDRDPGRYAATGDPDDLGAMRTPPLRYLKYTAPYMHNGVFFTLEEVVEFYNIGGTQDVFGTKSPIMQPLNLTRQEKQDLVAFLESLSGSEVTAETPELPDYEVLPGPSVGALITAARLKSGDLVATGSDAVTNANMGTDTASGFKIESSSGDSAGLTLLPRGSSEEDASDKRSETDESDAGAAVRVAAVTSGRFEVEAGVRYLTVRRGDTLRTIAQLAYGDETQFQRIFDANRHVLTNPNVVILGAKLRIPD